jgi:hypothetical protein
LGNKSTFVVNLLGLSIAEKAQKLDITKDINVSNYLAEEIFQKVQQFSEKLGNDQAYLKSVFEGYTSAVARAMQLQTMVVDLFKGGRKLEEGVVESISKMSTLNPENLPKMIRIKAFFKTIKEKQNRLFERFTAAKDFGKLKGIMRKFRSTLKRMERAIEGINQSLDSSEFSALITRTSSVLDVLKGMSFQNDLEEVRKKVSGIKAKVKEGNGWGLIGLIAFGMAVFAGSFCVFSAIKRAEEGSSRF